MSTPVSTSTCQAATVTSGTIHPRPRRAGAQPPSSSARNACPRACRDLQVAGQLPGRELVAAPGQPGRQRRRDRAGRAREDEDAVAQVDRLVQVVGDEDDRAPAPACTSSRTSCRLALVIASSAPNGSSMSSTSGLERERAGDLHALRHATGQAPRVVGCRGPAGPTIRSAWSTRRLTVPPGRSGAPARSRRCARRFATAAARCGSPGTPSPRWRADPRSVRRRG